MASIQSIVSPLTKDASHRAQVRVKGRSSESATFPNRREAEAWAASIETAIREGRHFLHAAAKRTSFDALTKDYIETVLADVDEVQRAARTLQLNWWSKQFAGKTIAEITADAISKARDACTTETFTRGKPRKDIATKAQLVARHPHLLSVNRVTWALRCRAANGPTAAVFDSPCGELLIHEPSFLAWSLGLSGRAKPRARRGTGRRLQGPLDIENNRGGPC